MKYDGEKKSYDAVRRQFENLGTSIDIANTLFLTSEFFLKFTLQYFLLRLVIQYRQHFATITHSLRFPLFPFRGIHWCSRKTVVFQRYLPIISLITTIPKIFQ